MQARRIKYLDFIFLGLLFTSCATNKQITKYSYYKVDRLQVDTVSEQSGAIVCNVVSYPSQKNPNAFLKINQIDIYKIYVREYRSYFSKDSSQLCDSTIILSTKQEKVIHPSLSFSRISVQIGKREKSYLIDTANNVSFNPQKDFSIKLSEFLRLTNISLAQADANPIWQTVPLKIISTELIERIKHQDFHIISNMLNSGYDPNTCDLFGQPAIICSAMDPR